MIPSGINIPNYCDIRQDFGFKNVSLANVINSGSVSNERVDFINNNDQDIMIKYKNQAFNVQVAIHELLGHGSGKLLVEDKDCNLNFDPSLINPLTGEKISSWYKGNQSYEQVFGKLHSTMEECRAE